jgi:hypothetical protein
MHRRPDHRLKRAAKTLVPHKISRFGYTGFFVSDLASPRNGLSSAAHCDSIAGDSQCFAV